MLFFSLVLQQEKSDDFVLASGEMHSVREFVEKSFAIAGITIRWEGYEVNEVGIDAQTGKIIVRVDRKLPLGYRHLSPSS